MVYRRIGVHQQAVVRIDQPEVAPTRWHVVAERVPLSREEPPGVHRQPVDVVPRPRAHGAHHDGEHAGRLPFGVRQTKDRAPRQAVDDPPIDAESLPQPLDVGEVVIHVDARPVDVVAGGTGGAAAAGALVEQHGSVATRIEVPARSRRATRARTAVQVHDGSPVRVAHLLVVQDVAVTDVELAGVERLGRLVRHRPSMSATTLAA